MADFQGKADDFRAADIALIAASVDPETEARKSLSELKLSYWIGYGLSAEEISQATGAFYEPQKKFLHATGFLLKPDGTVAHAVYSTGPIGRYTASDALDIMKNLSKK